MWDSPFSKGGKEGILKERVIKTDYEVSAYALVREVYSLSLPPLGGGRLGWGVGGTICQRIQKRSISP